MDPLTYNDRNEAFGMLFFDRIDRSRLPYVRVLSSYRFQRYATSKILLKKSY